MLRLTLKRQDCVQIFLDEMDPEQEPELKLFQSLNRNRNKSLLFHDHNTVLMNS